MLFNSLEYFIFLIAVFTLYWLVDSRGTRFQNLLLLAVSYVFYGMWQWKYLLLIVAVSALAFLCALLIGRSEDRRVRLIWLWTGVGVALSILALFKYYNFLVSQIALFFRGGADSLFLDVLLPVGISFYTFQCIGYCADVYHRKVQPSRNVLDFFTFVAFFPQLVAGPIERYSNLYPQIQNQRRFNSDDAFLGLRLILWGLFKKLVIADQAAVLVDWTFNDIVSRSSLTLWLGAMLFSIQIYCDFSGYSDIAIGSARLLGFKLMQNFRNPYLATGIKDFWSRWHISLTSWFRDYVYIPLGGNRTGHRNRNTWTVYLLSGLWHGANWTFLVWGAFHALLHQIERNTPKWIKVKFFQILFTFLLCTIGWVMFRAGDIGQASDYLHGMLSFSQPGGFQYSRLMMSEIVVAIAIMFGFEIVNRDDICSLRFNGRWRSVRFPFYLFIAVWTFISLTSRHRFIYFQF